MAPKNEVLKQLGHTAQPDIIIVSETNLRTTTKTTNLTYKTTHLLALTEFES